ncbi:CbiX protein [Halanaerobium saccharolyticum]|uniref:CbiX protein n=1 Tax=Halanaerobium saccharolyticum TaxID=43595 RepID=A0A4R7Z9R6_9FIRM|nr:CbiX/SirB N-terminal domain-containing protein [Halanaerobium saccharolyticum]RAK10564.1 CbiX protein [Halanaerobium saccharolyticum]TDW06679.1 CbiX protein [Halanaerobium saccharolyticum]TDX62314.1 CbiX protein [Halanaerobium saccharolyticum]
MGIKKVLVVVSHGSKRQESNQEFKDFIQELNEINSESKNGDEFGSLAVVSDEIGRSSALSSQYAEIKGACLEFASPQLETVIEDLMKEGYEYFDILPLFIFAGYHVKEDIPERMQKLKNNFEELDYKILDHPAAADDFAPYIFAHALGQK